MNFGSGSRHAAHGSVSSVSSTPFMTPATLQDMDMNMSGSTSNHGTPPGGGSSGQRKERGAIAAQACDTCRSRKQKCDEQRPLCGTCQKFKLACHYREPQPTKKDKTLGEILHRLKTLESKIDQLSLGGGTSRSGGGSSGVISKSSKGRDGSGASQGPTATKLEPALAETLSDLADLAHLTETPEMYDGPITASRTASMSAPKTGPTAPPPPSSGPAVGYRYSPATYQMLGWPVVQQLLAPLEHHTALPIPRTAQMPHGNAAADEHDAQAFFLGLHHETPAGSTPSSAFNAVPVSISTATPTPMPPPHWDTLYHISNAYFDSFNCIAPIVDRTTFFAATLPTVVESGLTTRTGHTRSSSSSSNVNINANSTASNEASRALAFLVLALGEVSMAETRGVRLHGQDASQPGPPGPSPPPGLGFFNKARQLMGFVLGETSLEAVQIHALAGIFCSTCLRHMEYWRFTTMASLSCHALLTSKPAELVSTRADVIRRIFWYCLIIETHFNIELGLPLTGLERLEHVVGLPDFSGPYSQDDYLANEALHFQEHYASQIVLRRLCAAFHTTLSDIDTGLCRTASIPQPSTPITSSAASHTTAESTRSSSVPSPVAYPSAARQMALQLDDWRGMLPQHLRWDDKQPQYLGYNEYASTYARPYALDMQAGILCTRYYFTKYLVHKPFLYKALHYPDQLSHDDALGAAACLQACLRWPLTMAPACTHKRLIPCVFFTSQNILGILIVLRLAQHVPILVRIKGLVASSNSEADSSGSVPASEFDRDAQETISLCVAWLRDLRGVDRAAAWAWEVVKGIYHLRE